MATAVICLDTSKAFELGPQAHPASEVISVFAHPLLTWLSSYLNESSQVVSIDGLPSNSRPVTGGKIEVSANALFAFLR